MSENEKLLPQIKVAEPEPSDENPWADDKLARKDCAEKLTAVIQGQIAPMTISVNGEWGSGKTFMLKRWQKQLSKDGYTAIYFNAWEDDFLTDPLVAILGQLQSVLISKLGEQVKKELSVGFKLVRNGVLRFITAGCVDPADLEPERNLLDDYADGIASRAELKEALEKLIAQLPQNKLPLVFIVDELDRCRPTFAIEVLERIKHLFNVDHMVFVLGIDRKNLGKSIQSVYGDIDVENYLHRFFDFDFRLPDAEPNKFITVLWARYKIEKRLQALSKSDANRRYDDDGHAFLKKIIPLLLLHRFTLREIEQCIKLYALTLKDEASVLRIYPDLIPILVVLKLKNLELYRKYINLECPPNEVIDFLVTPNIVENLRDQLSTAALIYATYFNDHRYKDGIKAIVDAASNKTALPVCPLVAGCVKMGSIPQRAYIANQISEFEWRYSPETLHTINEKLNLFDFLLER